MSDKSDFFECPAYKLMISDICKSVPVRTGKDISDIDGSEAEFDWFLTLTEVLSKSGSVDITSALPGSSPVKLHLKLIWVQGTVKRVEDVDENTKSLVITDEDEGTVEACVYDFDTVPGGDHPGIVQGSYVGALGQIWSADPVVLKAAKVMHLDSKPIFKQIWKDEVTLSKAYLTGLMQPLM